ncbi:Amuc_1100 family pilus-like protein [Kiritimatiella glycovorans]|uniref:Uncharacterized protein n=1 Tax=Kiritimatiella glycovorans TaxID=1307763 RepID=A0A0G3EGI6_9BACT|nr:Amuc_1100 family pilus-like protein [Kiritimatiella glycovorans]AKJ65453.1 hypothetical protein L21SP4_02226 [Kiritimatiella glycovorans]
MKWRKHMLLIVGGGILAVLLIGTLVYTVREQVKALRVGGELKQQQERLRELNRRDPFPSKENVAQMKENVNQLQDHMVDLIELMRREQRPNENIAPVAFASLLGRTRERMVGWAEDARVAVPEDFSFGFSRYVQGTIPQDKYVDRLVNQLYAVETLFHVLCVSGVREVTDIKRDVFEQALRAAAEPRTGRRGSRGGDQGQPAEAGSLEASHVDPDDLFTAERVQMSFNTKEAPIWRILHALSHSDRFSVVKIVNTDTQSDILDFDPESAKQEAEQGQGGDSGSQDQTVEAETEASREARKIAGDETITVTMVVDVYRFASNIALKESE